MELLEPVQGVGNQEVAHLPTPEVEDVRSPIRMFTTQRIGILVQGSAVETGKRPVILREVGWHPVQDDADTCLVEAVHQITEVVGRAVA